MNRKQRRALGDYKPKGIAPDSERVVVKVELPRVIAVDGQKIGKVKIASKDESFCEYVDLSFELEKLVGSTGVGFFELILKDDKIGGLHRIHVDNPW